MLNRTKIFSLTISLLLLTMLLPLSSCSQIETPPSAVTASTSPNIPITPGSLSFTTSAGEYWGGRGLGKPSSSDVLYDYVDFRTSFLRKVGYNIRIDVADKIENLPASREMPEGCTSIDDYLEMIVAAEPPVKKRIFIAYTGESNEIAVYTSEDVPKINVDAVKAAFQDKFFADPVLRVMVGVKELYDEVVSKEVIKRS